MGGRLAPRSSAATLRSLCLMSMPLTLAMTLSLSLVSAAFTVAAPDIEFCAEPELVFWPHATVKVAVNNREGAIATRRPIRRRGADKMSKDERGVCEVMARSLG